MPTGAIAAMDWAEVFAASPAATCIVGEDDRVVEVNQAFIELVGHSRAELVGGVFDKLLCLDSGKWGVPEIGRGVGLLMRADGQTRDATYAMAPLAAPLAAPPATGRRVLWLADVTDDKCYICKIFSSRDKFRSAIDDQSELICRLMPDLTITLVNRELASLCGMTPRSMVGTSLADHFPAASVAAMRAFLEDSRPGAVAAYAEEPWPLEGGRTRWINWRRIVVFGEDGRRVAVQSVGRDVTQRRLAEEERVRLAGMIERSPVVGIAWRCEGRLPVDYVTPNVERLGLSRAELLSPSAGLLDLVHPDEAARLAEWVATRQKAGAEAEEIVIRLTDGPAGERWIGVRGWSSGPERMEAVLSDVTERRAVHLALRERERRFRAIFDHTFEFIGLLTPDGRMIEANQTALSFIGARAEEVLGQSFWDTAWWKGDEEGAARLRAGVATAATGTFVRFETMHSAPDGALIHVDFSLRPIFDDDGAVVFLVPEGRDITHLKKTETALVAAKREAEFANRSKTHFLAVMSHELRTPLNAILGYSEVMRNGMFGPLGVPRYQDYIEAIHNSGQHLLAIIDDILEISRIELGVLEIDEDVGAVEDLVERAHQILLTRALEAGVTITVDFAPDLPALRCDGRRVVQMLVNLAVNGIKFSGRGGHLEIRAAREDDHLVLTVSDDGCGIAREDLDRIWEPFGQAGNAQIGRGGGVGLGLTITKALIVAHGGTITLDSELGKGTTVALRFPAERCVEMPGVGKSGVGKSGVETSGVETSAR